LERFTASDGARIAYSDEGAGRPLVLLHGLMAHSGFFERQRDLADAFRLIRIDLRGHGESPSDRGSPTIDMLGRDVAELSDHLGLEGAMGIGWSLGASVLWKLLEGPASCRFAGAVVVDMTPRVMNGDDWDLGLPPETCAARSRAIAEDFATFATAAGAAIFAPDGTAVPSPLAEWAGAEFAGNDAAAIGAIWASLVEQDFRPALGRIRQPTLVVHGAHSHLYDADTAHHLVAALPNASDACFEHSGHAPHLDEPDRFNLILRDFAASLPPVRQPQTQTA
jgi:pimeloyl-[acyl-carrier protein] methyl ester esterase